MAFTCFARVLSGRRVNPRPFENPVIDHAGIAPPAPPSQGGENNETANAQLVQDQLFITPSSPSWLEGTGPQPERRRQPLSTDIESSVESLDHPVDNAPVRTLEHKGLTIEGYSRAAVQTYWRVPELKLGFDLGRPALVVHGDAQLVRLAHPPRPHRGAAGLRRPAADDEDGAADDLPAGRGRRGRRAAPPRLPAARPRADAGEAGRAQARRGGRAVARAGRQGVRDPAHDPLAGLPGLGAAEEAQAGVSRTYRATRSATCGSRASRSRPRSGCPRSPTWATPRRRGSTPCPRSTGPRS